MTSAGKLTLAFFLAGVAVGVIFKIVPPLLAQGPIVGPGQPILCTKVAAIPAGGTGLTQIVAGVVGQSISVCGWHITNTASSGTFAFSTGTGSNCGTGTVTPIPAQNVNSTAPSSDHIDYVTLTLPQGNALCVNFSVTTIAGIVYYTQF
jgi:hypothetical protein